MVNGMEGLWKIYSIQKSLYEVTSLCVVRILKLILPLFKFSLVFHRFSAETVSENWIFESDVRRRRGREIQVDKISSHREKVNERVNGGKGGIERVRKT